MIFLVTGASSGYGKNVAARLREQNHEVYEAQRSPGNLELLDPTERLQYWRDCNFEDPADVLKMINSLMTKKVQLDGIFFAAVHRKECEINLLNAYELREHFMVNVALPVVTMLQMYRWQILKPTACVMFCLDRRPLNESLISYKVSKAAIPTTVEAFLDIVPELNCVYALLPDRTKTDITKPIRTVVDVLTGQTKSHRLLDLTD